MHITINKTELERGLDLVSRISTKHQTLPVLHCVLIEASEGGVPTLKATNLELGIEVELDGETKTTGTIAVPAQTLQQTIQLITDATITLKTKDNTLSIETKTARTQIKTLPHDEFPTIPTLNTSPQVVNGGRLTLAIKTTLFAASTSSIKPELGSVYLHQHKAHTLTAVTTDSFRLIEKTVSQKSLTLDQPILIPQKNAQEIARITEVVGTDPELRVSENQCTLTFSSENTRRTHLTSRLTEGTFPDYTQIIPKEFSTNITVLRGDLMQALKKTNIFINKFLQVGVVVDPNKNTLTLSADNGDLGTTKEDVSGSGEGEELTLSFNQRYLTEPLNHFTDDSVVLKFAGVGRPMVIEGAHESSIRYLVMPMNR